MAVYLPLFPLQLVVFPGERLHLHIFEERYQQLISECYNGTKAFGIPSFFGENMQDFGTEAEVTSIVKIYPDGKMDVKIKGLRTFKVIDFYKKAENALYPAGFVTFDHEYINYPINNLASEKVNTRLKEILLELAKVLDISKNLIPSRPQNMSFSIAHYLAMPLEKEYELLLTKNENERQLKLIEYIEFSMPDIKKRELIKTKIALNGHFKEIIPPNL